MFESTDTQDRLTRAAWLVALATLVMGQLHALARFATQDGKSDLDLPLTALWAKPAARALDPLLSWADPETVYLAYGKWWLPAMAVTVAAGVMVMRLRAPYGVERWGWRLMLPGFALLALGAGAFYWGQWTSYNVIGDVGLWIEVPGVLLGFVGATVLGIGLLRRGARPRLAGVLLLLAIPGLLGITEVTSLGNTGLPIMFAVALLASEAIARRESASTKISVSMASQPATQ
jgi:hypothetical protein